MSWIGLAAAAVLMIPIQPAPPDPGVLRWSAPPAAAPDRAAPPNIAELSVLTYNVRGLPWPIAWGRGAALRAIGQQLARLRQEGRQPDVVLIQEGFGDEIADLVRISGYRYWARGPARAARATDTPADGSRGWRSVRYRIHGEGWGKFTGSGLHVLSDLPIVDVESAVYRYCAGSDCLANKGVMLVRLALPGGRGEVDVVNTHMNSRGRCGVPGARSLEAHHLQTAELLAFVSRWASGARPLLVGGDFNVRGAPERYDYEAAARPYKVVAEFCSDPAAGCQGYAPLAKTRPWLRSQDLQAFQSSPSATVRPIRVEALFSAPGDGGRLSDHDGYLVRYRISWANGVDDPPGRPIQALRPVDGRVLAQRGQ